MEKNRLEAFSDGVIAIIITIMVLELNVPQRPDFAELKPLLPVFLSYVLSFIYLGIYWNNHHHLLNSTERVNGGMMWANLHLLFWLSLFPFATGWVGQNHLTPTPTARLWLRAADGRHRLLHSATRHHRPPGLRFDLAAAIGSDWKGKLSPGPLFHRHSAGVLPPVDCRRPLRVCRPLVACPRPPHRTRSGQTRGLNERKKPNPVLAGTQAIRQRLSGLRNALLVLHKALVDSERVSYEQTVGTIPSPNHFLQLLTGDPWFAW